MKAAFGKATFAERKATEGRRMMEAPLRLRPAAEPTGEIAGYVIPSNRSGTLGRRAFDMGGRRRQGAALRAADVAELIFVRRPRS